MATKLVNGVRIEMTAKEEAAFEASRTPMVKKQPRASEIDILRQALEDKGVLVPADLDAANTKLLTK